MEALLSKLEKRLIIAKYKFNKIKKTKKSRKLIKIRIKKLNKTRKINNKKDI